MDELIQALLRDLPALLFWILASLTALCAVAVVVSQNIVRSATWLLFTLGGTSAIFFLLGADFVGATQLLVYVGGTLVLVIFGVMLTAQGPFLNMKASVAEWAISGCVGLLLLAVLTVSILSHSTAKPGKTVAEFAPKTKLTSEGKTDREQRRQRNRSDDGAAQSRYADLIGEGFVGVGVGPAHQEPNQPEGYVIRTNYLLPFEIVSVHLLVVLIGAAYLARAKRKRRVEA
jgi:NADH-quinone oxidoreductase subunit J